METSVPRRTRPTEMIFVECDNSTAGTATMKLGKRKPAAPAYFGRTPFAVRRDGGRRKIANIMRQRSAILAARETFTRSPSDEPII
jgi:hypothetical protein